MSDLIWVLIWSLLISFASSAIYRVLTNPEEIRRIKKEARHYGDKMKKAQKAGDKANMNKYLNEQLKLQGKATKQHMKPMVVSMLLFFIALGWLNGQYSGFCVQMTGADPNCLAIDNATNSFSYMDSQYALTLEKDGDKVTGFVLNGKSHENFDMIRLEGKTYQVAGNQEKVMFSQILAISPVAIPFIGSYLSWFWWYFLIVIATSFLFRKLLGVE